MPKLAQKEKMAGFALVTGAALPMGEAIAYALAADGYDVALPYGNDRELAKIQTLCESIQKDFSVKAVAIFTNIYQAQMCEALVQSAKDIFGMPPAVLVNAHIFSPRKPFAEETPENLAEAVEKNVYSVMDMSRYVLPDMQEQCFGTIINLITTEAFGVFEAETATASSCMRAIAGFSKMLALDYGPRNVRVNCIAVSLDEDAEQTPLGAKAAPEDVARLCAYMVESPMMTAQVVQYDGGQARM